MLGLRQEYLGECLGLTQVKLNTMHLKTKVMLSMALLIIFIFHVQTKVNNKPVNTHSQIKIWLNLYTKVLLYQSAVLVLFYFFF